MRFRAGRIVAISAVALVALTAIALLVVHLPPIRARVLRLAAQQLASRYDLDLRAGDLHYNVITRTVSLDEVRLSAVGHEQAPFLTATRVAVALPWSVFRGLFAFDRIELDTARVDIQRYADGTSNLPSAGGPRDATRPPLTLDIRALELRGLDFAMADAARNFRIDAGGVRSSLAPRVVDLRREAFGPIAIERGVQIQIGERRIEAQPISGSMAFDGSALTLDNIGLAVREGKVRIDGTIQRVLDQPTLDLRFDGTAELARAADWATLPVVLDGATTVRGTIAGPAAEPTIVVDAKSDGVRLGGVNRAAIDAAVTITPTEVTVSRAGVRTGTGVVDTTARIDLGDEGTTELKAEWRNLDAATALRVIENPDTANGDRGTAKPLPYGSAIASSLTGRMTWQTRPGQPMALTLENRSVAPGTPPRDTVPLSGTLTLNMSGGRWSAAQQHVLGPLTIDGPLSGRITGNDFSAATIEGTLAVQSGDVAGAARAIERLGVVMPAIATEIQGPLTGTVALGGRVNALQATAAVASDALVIPGIAPANVRADVAVTPDRVDVPSMQATIGTASLTGNAAIDLQAKTLGGTFSLNAPNAGELLTTLPDNARLTGPVTATATLGGSTASPLVNAKIDGHDLTLAGQPIARLTATSRITSDTAFFDALSLATNTGTLTGTGSYTWSTRTYSADLKGADLSWSGRVAGDAETEVRITQLAFAGSGTVEQPGGKGHVAFTLSGGPAGDIVEQGDADVVLGGGRATIDARVPSLGAHLAGNVATSAPYTFDATAEIAQLDLLPLTQIAGLPTGSVLGRVSLTAAAKGRADDALASSEVTANIQQIAATVGAVDVWLASPFTAVWRQEDLRIDPLSLGFGSGMLSASGRLTGGADAQWTSTFKGELADLIQAAHAVAPQIPAELSATGAIAAAWQSAGGLDRSSATVSLANGQITWGDVPPVNGLAVQAGFDGTTITVSSLAGQWQEGSIAGTATVPAALLMGASGTGKEVPYSGKPGHAQLKVTGLTQASLKPWLNSAILARIVGRVSASFDADINGTRVEDIAGALVLDEAVLSLADIEVVQARPTRIGIKNGLLTMDDVSWTAGGGPLALTGKVELAAPKGPTLDLALKGDLNLGLISAFAPTTWTAGQAVVDVTATGLAGDPNVQGRIELQNGELAVFDPRLIMYDLHGTIALDRQRVRFGGINGALNGGTVRLDGQLGLSGDALRSGQLIVELGQVALEYPRGLLSETDALLTFQPRGTDWLLGGDVRIARSSYRENISLPALAAARRTRPPVAVNAEPTFLDRLRLNIFVNTEEDLGVDNNYGRIQAGAAVRVTGSANEPGLNGRVTLREGGEVFLAGRTFRVERGEISFTRPTSIDPEFDIELRTVANGRDVALTLNGTMNQLKTEVRSTSPDVTDEDARRALYGNLGTEDAATLLSAELLGVTGRAVGLDTLRIDRGMESDDFRNDPTLIVEDINDNQSTRLTLAKRVRPELEIIVSRSLQESGGIAAAVSYKVRRNVELRVSQRENTDRAVAVRHEITFGGGQARRAGSSGTVQPRVSAVRITGEPGRPEAELLEIVKLKVGDRFAFHEWQSDADRIKESYTARGYYEARVRPTRQASEDGQSVVLEYRVEQGARTTLSIEGLAMDGKLTEQLQEAWTRAIFDRFLIDDVRWRVQQELLNDGYFGSKVDPTITQPDPQSKHLRVTIVPGTHVAGRELRFKGNTAFSRSHLENALATQGVGDDAWFDPWRAANGLALFYQEQGYLGVNITPTDPIVEGNRAVLLLTIEEGRQFTFAKPTLTGTADTRMEALTRILGFNIHEGVAYDAAAVQRARERVEGYYLRRGFNSARIESRSTADYTAATVGVAFTIDEGLQQVLREVTTEGGERTRPGVVQGALRLPVGQPVDLTQWSQARKRIYDTNVFAQVDIEPVAITPTAEDTAAGIEPVRAVVRLTEYPNWRLRYGLQVNDVRTGDEDPASPDSSRNLNLGVLSDIQNRNIFGRAIAGGLAARVERDRQIGTLFASNGSFFGLPIRTQTFLFTSRRHQRPQQEDDLDLLVDRVGTSVEQRWQAFRRTEIVYSYRYDQTRTYERDPDPNPLFPPLDATNRTGKLTAGVIFDRRNDPFAATKGWFASANYDWAARALGGDSRNSRLLVQQYYFVPVGKIVFASRAQIGSAFGKDPLTSENAFEVGGATTVRGYPEAALGPKDAAGLSRGQALLLLNQEVRFPIKGWVNAVAFVDAGNTFATRGDLSFSDLMVGYGFGLRLDTPIAMLRVDFGVPGSRLVGSTRAPNSFSNGRWYIGIGHIF